MAIDSNVRDLTGNALERNIKIDPLRGAIGQYTPVAPSLSGGSKAPEDVSTKIKNLISNGAGPATTAAPAAAPAATSPTANMATLINPTTGDKQVVESGSQAAQQLFGQGYQLMGADGNPTGTAAAPATTPTSSVPGIPSTTTSEPTVGSVEWLRNQANMTRSEAFNAVYGYTPDEWQDLPPGTQRYLRNLRVQGLATQLGNLNSAIEVARQEELDARQTSLDTLNMYLQYGVLDQIPEGDLQKLVSDTGLSLEAVKAMAEPTAQPPELRQVGSNLYSIQYNPETGQFDSQLVISGKSGGGSGSGSSGSNQQEAQSWLQAVMNGLSINDVPSSYKDDVQNALATVASETYQYGPSLDNGGQPIDTMDFTPEQISKAQDILANQYSSQSKSSTESERFNEDLSNVISAIKANAVSVDQGYSDIMTTWGGTHGDEIDAMFKRLGY